jgi:hypothetical protein
MELESVGGHVRKSHRVSTQWRLVSDIDYGAQPPD